MILPPKMRNMLFWIFVQENQKIVNRIYHVRKHLKRSRRERRFVVFLCSGQYVNYVFNTMTKWIFTWQNEYSLGPWVALRVCSLLCMWKTAFFISKAKSWDLAKNTVWSGALVFIQFILQSLILPFCGTSSLPKTRI
jgi:hypothetical protein